MLARAKVGPRDGNWAVIGAVWERENGPGYVVVLHSLPISRDWNGLIVLKEPNSKEEADDAPEEPEPPAPSEVPPARGRRRVAEPAKDEPDIPF